MGGVIHLCNVLQTQRVSAEAGFEYKKRMLKDASLAPVGLRNKIRIEHRVEYKLLYRERASAAWNVARKFDK